jgi:hypothetical protein
MNICIRAGATLILALLSGHAAAIPMLRQVTPTFYQSGSNLNAGLIVEASTDLPVLVIAGGFTIRCSTSTLALPVQRRATFSSFFGPRESLRIPEVLPSSYAIPGWSDIPAGTCSGQCTMEYTGEATDATSLSIKIGSVGAGASFTLIPTGTQAEGNTILANVCRVAQRQCCTLSCSIP